MRVRFYGGPLHNQIRELPDDALVWDVPLVPRLSWQVDELDAKPTLDTITYRPWSVRRRDIWVADEAEK